MLVVCRKLKIPWKITYSVSVNAFAMESHGDWDSLEQIGTIRSKWSNVKNRCLGGACFLTQNAASVATIGVTLMLS